MHRTFLGGLHWLACASHLGAGTRPLCQRVSGHVPSSGRAANTPFQWTKQIASHFGGTRNPMVVSWPRRITDKGGLRSQFHHIIDVAPTILQAAGIPAPRVVNGVAQKPIEGVSMMYTFDSAAAPDRRSVQYFELLGNRAIYKDGWIAATQHGVPWKTAGQDKSFDADVWELYHVAKDFSQATTWPPSYPGKLKELRAAFDAEARKYNVYPLDDRFAQRFDTSLRPNALAGLKSFTYGPGVGYINESSMMSTHNVPFSVTAEVEAESGTAEGVIAAQGGGTSGWSLYVEGRAADLLLQLLRRRGIPRPVPHAAAEGEEHGAGGVHPRRAGARKARGGEAAGRRQAGRNRSRRKDRAAGLRRGRIRRREGQHLGGEPGLQVAVPVRRHGAQRDDRGGEIAIQLGN